MTEAKKKRFGIFNAKRAKPPVPLQAKKQDSEEPSGSDSEQSD